MADRAITVLAIDDNSDNLISIKALIKEAFPDSIVFTALTGRKGYEIAAAEDPDVILLDIVMPGMNGFEFCSKIKSNKSLSDIPVVFVTATRDDKESRVLALESGAEAFLGKPVDEIELVAQIRAMKKIKIANIEKRNEKQRLAMQVEERTRELQKAHVKTMDLLESLKKENEMRKKSEAALSASKEYFEMVFNTSPDAALVTRLNDGLIVNVNEGFTRLSGLAREEAVGKTLRELMFYLDNTERHRIMHALLEKGYCDGMEIALKRKDQSSFIGLLSGKVIMLNSIPHVSSTIHDITNRKIMEDKLKNISSHDYLTGLYNRRFFEEELRKIDTRKMLPLSVIVGDINGLRLINDAFGSPQGDRIIADTAKVIARCRRKGDLLARIGGDEFIVLMPKTNAESAFEILQNIESAFEKQNAQIANEIFHINVSLGFSTKITPDQDFNKIKKEAEDYMYQRKLLQHRSLHSTIIASIRATLLEKNEETEEHCERLVDLSREIGKMLNLTQKEQDEGELLSKLHDIGKIGISEQILNKQGKLTPEEWLEMKKHPEIGYRIAAAVPELLPIAGYILCHHERWDGKGYPQGLSGEKIPLPSRILAVVDAYDAMTQDRPYRKRMSQEKAVSEIIANAGTQFDPDVSHVFIENVLNISW